MNQDLISRQAILKHIEKKRQDALMIDDLRESNIIMMGMKLLEEAVRNQPSAQPEHLVKESGNLVKGLVNDCISRQAAIDAVNGMPDCPNGYSDTYDKRHIIAVLEEVPSVPNTFNALSALDCIDRQAAIDTLDVGAECLRRVLDETDIVGTEREKYKWGLRLFEACISDMKELPSAQPEITDGQAIEHLQSTGWMQNHDKQMYEMGLKEQLADDSGGYDSLIPSAQPDDWMERNKERILQDGMEGREIEFRIGGRLFAIREKAQ